MRPASSPVPQPQFSKGYAAVFATIAIWSLPSLFQFYLNRFYDPWAQNFYRYFVALLAILPFLLLPGLRKGGPAIDRAAVVACIWPCLPNVIHQVTQVMALYYIGPGVYAVFTRSSVIWTAVLALMLFPEGDASSGNGNSFSEPSSASLARSA